MPTKNQSGWGSAINPSNRAWPTPLANQISPRNTYRKTPQKDRENSVEWEAHRATIFCFSLVSTKHHIAVHLKQSARVHENLCSGVSALVKSNTRDWSSLINPSDGVWPSTSANQTGSLAKSIATYHYRKERNSVEWEDHRAATSNGSVCLEHHIGAHLQHSFRVHENLRAGRRRLNANNTVPRCYR